MLIVLMLMLLSVSTIQSTDCNTVSIPSESIPSEIKTCMQLLNDIDSDINAELPAAYQELYRQVVDHGDKPTLDKENVIASLDSTLKMLENCVVTDAIHKEFLPIIIDSFTTYRDDLINDNVKRGSNTNGRYLNLGITHALRAGSLTVDTEATIGGNLQVAGSANIGGDLTVDGVIKSDTATGSGVFAATNFTTNNALLRVDLPNGQKNIKQSGIIVDNSDNITGAQTVTATTFSAESEVRLQDAAGGQYVGLNAPTTVGTSYTVSLPSSAPTASQLLLAGSGTPTDLEWGTLGGAPVTTHIYYVAKGGSDSNDGSFNAPFLTVAKGITAANAISSAGAPTIVQIGAGFFSEDNSAGPLAITSAGIAVRGASVASTFIAPTDLTKNLFSSTVAGTGFLGMTCTVVGGTSTAACISCTTTAANGLRIENAIISLFATGLLFDGVDGSGVALITDSSFGINGINISLANARGFIKSSTITGSSGGGAPDLTGLVVTGSTSVVNVLSTAFGSLTNAVTVSSGSTLRIIGSLFTITTNTLAASGGAHLDVVGSLFSTNNISSMNIFATGAGTNVNIDSSDMTGLDSSSVKQGTAIKVVDEARIVVTGVEITGMVLALQCGDTPTTEPSTTTLLCNGAILTDNDGDITQFGLSTLQYTAGDADTTNITVENGTNVQLAYFDSSDNNILKIGKFADTDTFILEAMTSKINPNPSFEYRTGFYGTKALGYDNLNGDAATWFVQTLDDSCAAVVTTDRTKESIVRLVSDTASPVGGVTALRGWDLVKNSSAAELAFKYQNSDPSGQTAITQYTAMQLDGVNNQLTLPRTPSGDVLHQPKIILGGDTNLSRSGIGLLTIDDNLIVSGIAANSAIATNDNSKFVDSATTSTQLGYLSTTTSDVQIQLDAKVAIAGDTMTGSLVLPAGSTASPSLNFTGSVTSGLSAASNALSLSSNAVERINIASGGTISIPAFTTSNAVVLANGSGALSAALITTSNISGTAAITNGQLASPSSVAGNNTLVLRDGTGIFATSRITGLNAPTAGTDAANKTYVDTLSSTGLDIKATATTVEQTGNITLSGLQTINNVLTAVNDRVLLLDQTTTPPAGVENGLWLAQVGAWTRPLDFDTGDAAGNAFVLISNGNLAGSSWLCSTPAAVIDTDAIQFEQFGLESSITTGNNVGGAAGEVFRNKVSNLLNFRTIAGGTHVTPVTAGDVITISTDAVSANTVSTIVARDGSGDFSAGTITASLTGLASLNVPLNGGTMTGNLTLPVGATATPSLNFTGFTTTGLSAGSGDISVSTAAVERMKFAAGGDLSIPAFTTAGILHNAITTGILSSSLIVNADVDAGAAIVDTKLATIATALKVSNSATTAASANTASAIVARDGSGNFTAGTISAALNGTASGNLPLTGGTLSGALALPAGSAAAPSLNFTGSTTTGLSASAGNLSLATSGAERINISSAGTVKITDLAGTAGIVHNDSAGNLSSSLIVNSDITTSTITNSRLATISNTNTGGNIVVRDGSGNFATTMITLSGTTTAGTDAATKAYVDSVTGTGIVIKEAAVTTTQSGNITLSGLQTINTVILGANDRVLLIDQTDPIENGLWLAQTTAWTRPTDFDTGNAAGNAFVLISEGSLAGSSWLCSTPNAIIDTGAIEFEQFSLESSITTGNNVGTGAGEVFRNKVSNLLNFKTIAASTHVTVTNNADDITLGSDGTNLNTVSTLVARDGSGDFSANAITLASKINNTTGTLAAPSYTFTGDGDTGMSSVAANTIDLSTGGTSRLNINSSGNVTYSSNYKMAAYASSTQTISSTTETVTYDTELFDPNSNFTANTYTAPVTGYYSVSASVYVEAMSNSTADPRSIAIVKNGTPVTGYGAGFTVVRNGERGTLNAASLVQLTAGDTLRIDFTGRTNGGGDVIQPDFTNLSIYFSSI